MCLKEAIQCMTSPDASRKIDLQSKWIGDIGAIEIARGIQSGNARENLRIILTHNGIGDTGVIAIANALRSGNAPKGLHIVLCNNNFDDIGATAIATALQSGYAPRGLHINLSFNKISDIGAKAIATALQSGNAPYGLNINLSCNKISDIGATAIATALQSGNAPRGLHINLSLNEISHIGAKATATALQSGNAPQEFQISLKPKSLRPHLNIDTTNSGAAALIQSHQALATSDEPSYVTGSFAGDLEQALQDSLETARTSSIGMFSQRAACQTNIAEAVETQIPKNFICPITHEVMQDPVILSDGTSYERHAITQWFEAGNNTSPMTRLPVNQTLIPNRALKNLIEEFLKNDYKLATEHTTHISLI